MKNSLKENLEKNFKENVIPAVMPVVHQIKERITEGLDRRFPKESRDQVIQSVLTNILSAKETLEKTAKDVAEQSRESEIVQKYVRPLVGSEKTEQALITIENRVSSARPIVNKLQNLREQFLASTTSQKSDATSETLNGSSPSEATDDEPTTPKRRKTRSKSDA
jgi:hypothetical protein